LKLLVGPGGLREVGKFNHLEKGLGKEPVIELQRVSVSAPKPLPALLSLAFPCRFVDECSRLVAAFHWLSIGWTLVD
jgi:hypothetical protein